MELQPHGRNDSVDSWLCSFCQGLESCLVATIRADSIGIWTITKSLGIPFSELVDRFPMGHDHHDPH